jgi:hypothetical protein
VSHPEPVVFRVSRWRVLVSITLILVLVILLIRGLAMVAAVAAGASLDFSDYAEAALVTLGTAAAGGGGAMIGVGQNPGWLRMSAEGLEFAPPRHRATFVPWAAVTSARLRFPGPFRQVVLTVADPAAVWYAQTPGRTARLRRGAFVMDVGWMTPGPAALLAELNRHRTGVTAQL